MGGGVQVHNHGPRRQSAGGLSAFTVVVLAVGQWAGKPVKLWQRIDSLGWLESGCLCPSEAGMPHLTSHECWPTLVLWNHTERQRALSLLRVISFPGLDSAQCTSTESGCWLWLWLWLQEEVAQKSKQLKVLYTRYRERRAEAADLQAQFQVEREDLLADYRALSQQIKLKNLAIAAFIPPAYQDLIMARCRWNEYGEQWVIAGVQAAGEPGDPGPMQSQDMRIIPVAESFRPCHAQQHPTHVGKRHQVKMAHPSNCSTAALSSMQCSALQWHLLLQVKLAMQCCEILYAESRCAQ